MRHRQSGLDAERRCLARGNGGQIVVWSDQQTSFAGLARAAAAQQGDGGRIEVSGQAALDWQGTANVSAAAGQPGLLLLDPKNITVAGPTFTEFVDPNPAAVNWFGKSVVPLSTGNVVITSPYDDFGAANAGAVYLFNGATGALISALRGSTASDFVGYVVSGNAVTLLTNGNYVVSTPSWHNGAANSAGAVTWGSGTAGVSGVVSSANSLVGSHANDQVGVVSSGSAVTALINGNYVVCSPYWDNGAATDAGAVTWGSGTAGVSGVVSSANSLVGSTANDKLGYASSGSAVIVLSNGNYVVRSYYWDNGAATDAGAVTWGSGTAGISGAVSSANSLIGSTANDQVGSDSVIALSNGNFVVSSYYWDNGAATHAGAVTWGSGTAGVSGVVSSANSLVGSTTNDYVGSVTELSNGNYVVRSPSWDNGAVTDAGAVTWGSGTVGVKGVVSSANSLIGSHAFDQVGNHGVTPLTNGNYVVCSIYWDYGTVSSAGAVTWGSGTSGVSGGISITNSLVGSHANDYVGTDVTALTNGNYVVCSIDWDNGAVTDAGAVTWGNGTSGIKGHISSVNSLVGSHVNDQVGYIGVTELANGNYVVCSRYWDNGTATDAGAATWGSGTAGISGVVSSANSLVGSHANDQVGSDISGSSGVTALTNGNYVVGSPSWDNGSTIDAGAVTWGSGTAGVSGVISSDNSLVGSTASDQLGYSAYGGGGVTALTNGNYLVGSPLWDNGAATNAGAVTWGSGTTGISGVVSSVNSLVGSTTNDVVGMTWYGDAITELTNGNYVVSSLFWNNGAVTDAGAVTWGSGTAGVSGVVSSANSLVGSNVVDVVGDGGGGYSGVTALANGNYVVRSTNWHNGAVADAGAVTWGSGTAGVSGVVSSANSLVGSTTNDQVGYISSGSAVTALSNGNYVVFSPSWDNGAVTDAGAATWGSGSVGVSGVVSSANSIVGLTSNWGLQPVVVDNVNGTFYATFLNEAGTPPGGGTFGGRVRVGSQITSPNTPPLASQTFASQTGVSVTLTPAVTGTLNTGAAVTLQASNDITIASAITADNPGGNGGNLAFQAGRSLLINANITTDNGNLTLTANDTVANGVVDADRESGSAVITQAGGTALNVGSGTLTVNLRNSTDKTYNDHGAATLQDVTAGSIVLGDGAISANSISTGNLTIGAGVTLTLASIPGGPQGAKHLQNTLTKPLDAGAISPIASVITDQAAVTSPIEQSPSTAAAVAPGPLAASTVLAAHVLATNGAETTAASPSSLLNDSNKTSYLCRNALTPGPSPDQPTMPTNASRRCPMVPVGARRGEVLLLIDTVSNRLASQSPIYYWFDSTALPKISENRLENPLAGKQISNANTAVFALLHDELPLRAGIIEERANTPAREAAKGDSPIFVDMKIGTVPDFGALQTNGFTRSVKSTSGEKTASEADFEIDRHARAGKHAGQLEKAIDTVIGEDEDLFLLVE